MVVYRKEDIENRPVLKRFKEIGAEVVVSFPADANIAPCGCWTITVETPIGMVETAEHYCGKHMVDQD